MLIVMQVMCVIIVGIACYRIGRQAGEEDEKARSEHLIYCALNRRYSGSLRWVLNAVSEKRKELMPEEQFFGDNKE